MLCAPNPSCPKRLRCRRPPDAGRRGNCSSASRPPARPRPALNPRRPAAARAPDPWVSPPAAGTPPGSSPLFAASVPPRVLMAAAPSPGPAWSRAAAGDRVRCGAARPSAPRANQPDRPSLPMTRRQAALATMGLRVCHGRSQQRHALRRSAGRRVAPRAPCSRPPHSHRDRRRDADKSARGQPRHAATSPTARSISAHFHWRKSVPHPVTEYLLNNARFQLDVPLHAGSMAGSSLDSKSFRSNISGRYVAPLPSLIK